ncbi:MAG: hypothetical protein IT329_17855 [Caldilineaceae bacterium]|nr:hypothetical protein [Caldilineaceae bacterium]
MGRLLGIIDSLSAGYRFLGRRLELLLVPVLLDLLLWLAPRLSIAPLLRQVAAFYASATTLEGLPADLTALSRQVSEQLTAGGQRSNLLEMLVNSSLLHVPSLLATLGPVSQGRILEIDHPLAAFGLFGGFGLLGLLLGVVYMNLLAQRLPLGSAPKASDPGSFVQTVARQWVMVVLYLLLLLVLLAAGAIPALVATAMMSLFSPVLGSFLMVLFSGAVLVLFFYLFFVTAALVLDNLPIHLAVAQSFVLVRNNFWATLGFVVLSNVILAGVALLVARLTAWSPLGIVAAIVIYAYIGSGLAMALLVFYRTRVLREGQAS